MRLGYATIGVVVLTAMPRLTEAADQTLLLEVQVNGHSTGKIGEFTLRDGALVVRRGELRDLGFRVPDSLPIGADGLCALSELPGVSWRLDQLSQTLFVTAANDRLLPALLMALGGGPVGGDAVQSGTGATLNYDITGTSVGAQNVAGGLFDLRVFSPRGVASSGLLAYAGGGPRGSGTQSSIRLDSTYTLSDPDTLRRYRLGDFITGGLGWTRPVRLGGAQVTSDFSMRPDLVTFPLPSVSGSSAVPSTVDVLVNGIRTFSHPVEAGPFEIPQLPVVTGAGTIAMTLTNALGQQVLATLPFYASSALLAPGLHTFSAQAGAVRRNWGLLSNDYGDFAATAIYRRGLSPGVTVEASAEGTAGTFMAGGGVVMNVGNIALLNVAAAGSTGAGRAGMQLSAGIERHGTVFSFGASLTVAGHDFRDVAAMSGDPVPRLQLNVSAGLSLGRFGSAGVAYAGVDRDIAPSPVKLFVPPGSVLAQNPPQDEVVYFQPAQHTHIFSASYSIPIRDMSIYVTGFHDFAGSGGSGMLVGLTIPLGTRTSVGGSLVSGSSGGYEQVQAAQSAVTIGDWGYQLYGSNGSSSHEFAQLQYKSPWTLLSAGADRIDGQTSLRLESQGSVSIVDGGMFASNTIQDSFAVVDTSGLGHVHVLQENRDVGSTDSAGLLLVPDLRSFDFNHIGIEPTDIPPDATIGVIAREVRPQDRSGVVVRFPVRISHGALLRLVDETGIPVPVGSTATLRVSSAAVPVPVPVPVGYDGNAYVQHLDLTNELDVELPDGRRCSVAFDYRPVQGDIPTIGPLSCRDQRP
jgi:outer membrane usher protein